MIPEPALSLSSQLAAELAANDQRPAFDPTRVEVRHSHLKAMGQSAAHCLAAMQQPDWKDSLALRLGKGVHAMTFGDKQIAKWTGKKRAGKVWDAFEAEHSRAGRVILSAKEYAKSEAIATALRNHHEASLLLFAPGAVREETLRYEQLGRARRSTPDVRTEHYVCELKTTRCAQPGRFVRDAMFRGYHAQLADQLEAVRIVTGRRQSKAYIVAVETVPPYAVTVLELTERAIEKGAALNRMWLERLLVCEASGHWPAYCESIEMFDVPDDEIDLVFGADDPDSTEQEGADE